MTDAVPLIPKAMLAAELVRADVRTLAEYVDKRDVVSIATVLVCADGTVATQHRVVANGRAALLGAVTDLQYDLCKRGD